MSDTVAEVIEAVADGLTITIEGGGFRPIRMTDWIDSIALDALDAYDHEQAVADAKRTAQAQANAPRW